MMELTQNYVSVTIVGDNSAEYLSSATSALVKVMDVLCRNFGTLPAQ
jgi:hypothetical protein